MNPNDLFNAYWKYTCLWYSVLMFIVSEQQTCSQKNTLGNIQYWETGFDNHWGLIKSGIWKIGCLLGERETSRGFMKKMALCWVFKGNQIFAWLRRALQIEAKGCEKLLETENYESSNNVPKHYEKRLENFC